MCCVQTLCASAAHDKECTHDVSARLRQRLDVHVERGVVQAVASVLLQAVQQRVVVLRRRLATAEDPVVEVGVVLL